MRERRLSDAPPRRGELGARALAVLLGCLLCQLGLGWGYATNAIAPDLLAEFGWSRALLSSARFPQIAAMALASPLVGLLVVRRGARPVLAASVVLLGVSFAAQASIGAFWQYQLASLALGLALAGLGDVAIGAVVAQWVRRARGVGLGVVYTGSNFGGMLVTPLVATVAAAHGWRAGLWAAGLAGVALMLPAALFLVREPRPGEGAPRGSTGSEETGHAGDLSLREALGTRSFWLLAFGLFACLFYQIGATDHLVLVLTDGGMEKTAAAGWLARAIGLGIASKILFGLAADRMRPRSAMLVNTAILTASSIAMLFLPARSALYLFVGLFGWAAAARDVAFPLLLADSFGVRHLAAIYGALMLGLLPGGILGPIFAGAVHDRVGSYGPAFASFAALNALAFVALALVRSERATHPVGASRGRSRSR